MNEVTGENRTLELRCQKHSGGDGLLRVYREQPPRSLEPCDTGGCGHLPAWSAAQGSVVIRGLEPAVSSYPFAPALLQKPLLLTPQRRHPSTPAFHLARQLEM